MATRDRLACSWADIVLVGVVINLAVLVTTPLLRPDLNLLEKSLSYYALGPWGALQTLAFTALGIASAALAMALRRSGLSSVWMRLTIFQLMVSSVASLGLVWYPMGAGGPSTFLGDAHQTAGTVGGVAQIGAALAFTVAIQRNSSWGRWCLAAAGAVILAFVGALLSQAAIWWPDLDIPMGVTMRLLVIPLVLLWGLVALRLRRMCLFRVNQCFAET